MDSDSHHGPGHGHHNDFAQSPWVDVGSFPSQQSPPLSDYPGFGYGPPSVMSMGGPFAMSMPPPPYASLPLTNSSHTWPSMLANQAPYSDPALPLASAAPPVSAPTPAPPSRKPSIGGSTPRRTLTDEDRRNMCLYHEDNKTAKQTDIGVLFGVERSTVSKVLRQKEKYLNPDDGSRSPIKRAKGKVPDIEKALSNWARNYQRQGFCLTDEAIREKALFFASTCGFTEGKSRVLSSNWLARFKQRYHLTGPKARKKSSDTRSESESPTRLSVNQESSVQSPSSASPAASPSAFASPSPLSPTQAQDNVKQELKDSLTDIADAFQHVHSKSTTSIDTSPSFSTSLTSPASTLVSNSPFTPASQSRIPSTDSNSGRPWSQTFTQAGIEPTLVPSDECFDKIPPRTAGVSVLQSPPEEAPSPKAADTDASNTVKRNRSNPEIRTKSIYPPASSKSNTVSPVSSPDSPTQDEARRALELVMNYFEHQQTGIGAQEYISMGKLMERLKLAQSQQSILPGGLTRIDELDDATHVRKKRSIHDLNWS